MPETDFVATYVKPQYNHLHGFDVEPKYKDPQYFGHPDINRFHPLEDGILDVSSETRSDPNNDNTLLLFKGLYSSVQGFPVSDHYRDPLMDPRIPEKKSSSLNIANQKNNSISEPTFEEAPVVSESPMIEEAPMVAPMEAPTVEEAPVVSESPMVEEAPVVSESPMVEEAPMVSESPMVEEAPMAPMVCNVPMDSVPPMEFVTPMNISSPPELANISEEKRMEPFVPESQTVVLGVQSTTAMHTMTAAVQQMPPAMHTMTAAVQQMPPAMHTMKAAVQQMPPAMHTMTAAVQQMPPVMHTMKPAVQQMPPVMHTMPATMKEMLPMTQFPPAVQSSLSSEVTQNLPKVQTTAGLKGEKRYLSHVLQAQGGTMLQQTSQGGLILVPPKDSPVQQTHATAYLQERYRPGVGPFFPQNITENNNAAKLSYQNDYYKFVPQNSTSSSPPSQMKETRQYVMMPSPTTLDGLQEKLLRPSTVSGTLEKVPTYNVEVKPNIMASKPTQSSSYYNRVGETWNGALATNVSSPTNFYNSSYATNTTPNRPYSSTTIPYRFASPPTYYSGPNIVDSRYGGWMSRQQQVSPLEGRRGVQTVVSSGVNSYISPNKFKHRSLQPSEYQENKATRYIKKNEEAGSFCSVDRVLCQGRT